MKKVGLLLSSVFILNQISAQSFKQSINTGLDDYMLPIVMVVFLMGAIFGLVKNWELINDKHSRKEGFINVGMILLYVVIAVAVIGAVISLAGGINLQI